MNLFGWSQIAPRSRDGAQSFEVPGGFIVRHRETGWTAFDADGRVVARGVSTDREAARLLESAAA